MNRKFKYIRNVFLVIVAILIFILDIEKTYDMFWIILCLWSIYTIINTKFNIFNDYEIILENIKSTQVTINDKDKYVEYFRKKRIKVAIFVLINSLLIALVSKSSFFNFLKFTLEKILLSVVMITMFLTFFMFLFKIKKTGVATFKRLNK
jgi:hypothetical protein